MKVTKHISKQRLSDFLAARLRAKRIDEPRAKPTSADSSPIASARAKEATAPAAQS